MKYSEYTEFAAALARKAEVEDGLHRYFLLHRSRLWQTASHFNLWSVRDKKVLEIGPFFSYTPFVLSGQNNQVTVFEGEDPAVYPLKPLYQERGIEFVIGDLFEIFGSPGGAHRLPFPDSQFDLIFCWETMEHFNFNPVGFVRDLRRVLKPGGEACLTVPNVAKLDQRFKLLLGKGIGPTVESYNQYHDYAGGRFLGFHWREYALPEFTRLFATQDFEVVSAHHLLTYQHHERMTFPRQLKRLAGRCAFALLPSVGSLCAIVAKKPAPAQKA